MRLRGVVDFLRFLIHPRRSLEDTGRHRRDSLYRLHEAAADLRESTQMTRHLRDLEHPRNGTHP